MVHQPFSEDDLRNAAGALALAVRTASMLLAEITPGEAPFYQWGRYLFLAGAQAYRHRLPPEKQQEILADLIQESRLMPKHQISDEVLANLLSGLLRDEEAITRPEN